MQALLIDDDELDRASVMRSLKATQGSYTVDIADCANSAWEKINDKRYDVILLDYLLPDIDGLDFMLELKSKAAKNNTAVLMISNLEDEQLAIKCLRAGAQDFLLKSSINPIMLKTAIANSVIRHELESALHDSFNKVKSLSEKDSLTGLANRFIFEQTVDYAIRQRSRTHPVTLFFIDIDNFKKINDTWGHSYGDKLLKRVAKRIASCLRGGEMLARIGGDEFAVFIDNTKSPADANRAAQRLLRVMQTPFQFDAFNFYASVSIGITIQSRSSVDVQQLLAQADIAMHKAKGLGKSQICYFQDAMQQEFIARVRIEDGLRQALKKRELIMFFQPIVSPASGEVLGYEALIRWRHNNVLISPDKFIPIAQESNLIMDIGRWIIEDVVSNHPPLTSDTQYLSINLSPLQLKDPALLNFIDDCVKSSNIKPGQIEFEITETAFIDDKDTVRGLIQDLRERGYGIALDDFGTGFSSLSHLRDFPITTVKIDKTLLPTEQNPRQEMLLEGLCQLIQALDLDVVQEGIETKEQAALCARLGVIRAQGYYYEKPQPLLHFLT